MLKTQNLLFFVFFIFFISPQIKAEQTDPSPLQTLNDILTHTQKNPAYNQTYIYNGCFVRAHFLAYQMHLKNLDPVKIFLNVKNETDRIYFPHSNPAKNPAKWVYHVVAALQIEREIYVLDTAVSWTALKLTDWLSIIQNQPMNQKTEFAWQVVPASEYTPETEYNDEFKSLGPPFSKEAMAQIDDDMQGLFDYEKADGTLHP